MTINLVSEPNAVLTNMALIVIVDKIMQALQNGDIVIGVYLDFSKAFDTVDHRILLDGAALNWFTSYLWAITVCESP